MRISSAYYLQDTGVTNLEIRLRFGRSIPGLSYRRWGQYNFFPVEYGTLKLIRTFVIEISSASARVCLGLDSIDHQLYPQDIEFCERELLRSAKKPQDSLLVSKTYKLIRWSFVARLNALMFQDKELSRKESARNQSGNP